MGAVGDLQRLAHVLLDQQHRQALAMQAPDQREQLLHQQRRQAQRGLVQDQQPRLGHQAAGDGQHLLLATAHRAGLLGQALGQPGEDRQHLVPVGSAPRPRPGEGAECQVLGHRQVGEDAPPLGHLDQPGLHHRAVVGARQVMAVKAHAPAPGRQQAADREVQRGLAGAVAAQQRDDLVGPHRQADAAQHLHPAIAAAQVLHVEQGFLGHRATPAAARSRAAVPWPR